MNSLSYVTVVSTIATTLGVLIYVFKASFDYSRLKAYVEQLHDRVEEDRRMNGVKISELYDSRNTLNIKIAEMTQKIEFLTRELERSFEQIVDGQAKLTEAMVNLEERLAR